MQRRLSNIYKTLEEAQQIPSETLLCNQGCACMTIRAHMWVRCCFVANVGVGMGFARMWLGF